MVHCYVALKVEGLYCATASGFRVWVSGLLFFVFKLTSLVLNQVPSCIWKLKTDTFDESIKFLFRLVILGCFMSFLDHFRSFRPLSSFPTLVSTYVTLIWGLVILQCFFKLKIFTTKSEKNICKIWCVWKHVKLTLHRNFPLTK